MGREHEKVKLHSEAMPTIKQEVKLPLSSYTFPRLACTNSSFLLAV